MQVVHINAKLDWQCVRTPRGMVVAACDPLAITLEADDEYELNSLINETLQELFRDLLEEGEFEKFLRDRGWTPSTTVAPGVPVRFDVPFRIVQQPRLLIGCDGCRPSRAST